jgi:hypothetical protein
MRFALTYIGLHMQYLKSNVQFMCLMYFGLEISIYIINFMKFLAWNLNLNLFYFWGFKS